MLKTGRVLIVNEDTEVTNFGEHLLRRVVDEHFYDLLVRPRVLLGKHVPGIGLNQMYEWNEVPQLPNVRWRCGSWRPKRRDSDARAASAVTERLASKLVPADLEDDHGLSSARSSAKASTRPRWSAGWSSPATGQATARALMEVMTDKATMEVPAPFAGTVTELRVQPGDDDQSRRPDPVATRRPARRCPRRSAAPAPAGR